tara:strand:+ start:2991 stop:3533 length:543 start_codon:yes stop_codon:yes gene_type:complete
MMRLHLGCGWRNFGKDWIHIDAGTYEHLDYHSITDLSQFDDDSIDLIYASHVVEYFDRDEFSEVLKEWHRVLKPQAILRLAVPDFDALAMLYISGEIQLDNVLGPLYGKMSMGNETIYHKTVYDFKSMKAFLEFHNFQRVERYDWRKTDHAHFDDHSQAYVPHMQKETGTLTSLNVECIK